MHNNTERQHTLVMSELMTPNMANFGGKVHGGYLLSMLDRVAYCCASRYTGTYIVTLSVDQVLFKEPINVGELVTFHASINYVGKTSLEVGIRVTAENLLTQSRRHTNSCYFTMVAVDETGKPVKIHPFTPITAIEKHRYEAAQHRKALRLQSKT